MRAKLINEKEFVRGKDPKHALNIGMANKIFQSCGKPHGEGGGYSFDYYGPKNWMDIIRWLLGKGYTPEETEQVMRSKLMRWTSDNFDKVDGDCTLKHFLKFNNNPGHKNRGKTQVDDFLDQHFPDEERWRRIKKSVTEDAMGGVSAPMSTLGNTPGMGNAQPASSASTGTMNVSNTGSGDKWDASIGKINTQNTNESEYVKYEGSSYEIIDEDPAQNRILIRSLRNPYGGPRLSSPVNTPPFWVDLDSPQLVRNTEEVNEQNINPHDKLGVAMAKKMGVPLTFKKGKGDKDVEQIKVDEDIDLSTSLMTFDEWSKKFF
jgi:hypothetical protein